MTELKPLTTFKYTTDILQKLVEKKHWSAEDAMKFLNEIPTADVVEVVHAEWVGTEYDGYADGYPVYDKWECSHCHEEFSSEGEPPLHNYCPECGAKMDGERREE